MSDEFDKTGTELSYDKTSRGFGVIAFKDRYGVDCSIQDSSLATEPAIWFGPNEANPKILISGSGWQPYEIPKEVLLTTRMHLTQEMVRQLLPILQHFAKTGNYVSIPKNENRS